MSYLKGLVQFTQSSSKANQIDDGSGNSEPGGDGRMAWLRRFRIPNRLAIACFGGLDTVLRYFRRLIGRTSF